MSSAWEEVTCTKSDQPEDLAQDASADHEGLAWEISFSSGEEKKPKRPVPRFLLGEREKKQRSEQLKKDTSPKVSPPQIKSSPLKAKTTPEKRSKSPFSKPFSKPFSSSLSPKMSAKVPLPTGEKSPISRRALLPGKVWGSKSVKSPEEKRPSSANSSKSPSHQTLTNRPSSAKSPVEIKRGSKSPQSPPVSGSQTTPPSPIRHQSPRVGKSVAHSSNDLRSNQQPSTGAGDLRTKMKESLESESSTGLHAELESSASCGGTVWEIDLSSFKTGKSSRQPYSKEAPPTKSSVFSRPLQPKQLVKVMLPSSEPSTSPAPTLMRTPQDMELRKVLDLRRWYCMCRPQYSRSCGLSSVISCWNYLFSTLGSGSLPPVTQEEALTLLGFQPPFGEIRFGPFTGNATVMRWFQDLCNHYGVEGQAYYFYKPVGKAKTFGIKPNMAYESLKEGLQNPSMAFVYHCLNHYFCPIGYEEIPKNAADAYKMNLPADALDSWLLIGDPSRKHPGIHCKRWEDVVKDLTCKQPEYFNIRHTERGIQTRRTKKVGGNLHCIMAFKKLEERAPMSSGGTTLNFSPPQPPPGDLASLVDEAASENLDSSDSDYPLTQDLDREPSWATKLRVHSPEVWGAVDIENIDTNELVVEEVDAPLQTHNLQTDDKTISAELSHKRSGTFTKRKEVESDKLSSQNPPTASDDVSDEGFVLVPSAHLTTPEIQVTATLDSDEDAGSPSLTRIKRTGTFTKKRSSLSPTQQESPPSEQKPASGKVRTGTYKKKSPSLKLSSSELSGEDSDSSVEATNLTSSPFKRSGTFTKKKPLLGAKEEADGSELSHDPAALSGDELSVEATNLTSSPFKRSGTFTKKKPLLGAKDEADGSELSHDPAVLSGDELSVEATNLTSSPFKRSGTFTKKKPLLGAKDEADGSELSHDRAVLSGDELNVEATNLMSSPLKRSGTFTKKKPLLRAKDEADGSELSHDPAVLSGDELSVEATNLTSSPLKRSGTFTKKKPLLRAKDETDGSELSHDLPSPSHDPASLSGDELSVDLDDTLKADFPEIQIIGVSDGESSCEEAVLPSPSNLKRTGTFTKKRPLLPNSPTV